MTSNYVAVYYIFNKKGEQVGNHSQHLMCSRNNDRLLKYQPPSDYTIIMEGYSEDEGEQWFGIKHNLEKWLKDNPAQITSIKFEKGDKVRFLHKKDGKEVRVEGVVVERGKGKWFPIYSIELKNGEIIEDVCQTKVLPLFFI